MTLRALRLAAVIVLVAVATATGGANVATAASKPVPAAAKEWLGTWHTRFGELYFDDVHWQNSGIEDAHGNYEYYWELTGTWDRPNHPTTDVHGAIGKSPYGTFQGCWTPPKGPGVTSCAAILVFRYGKELRGGYWKPCALQEICKSHMDWKGFKTQGAWIAGFRFLQRGRPDGHTTIKTQTGGAGSLVFKTESKTRGGSPSAGSHVFHIDEIPDAADLHLTLLPLFGSYESGDRFRQVTVVLAVEKSTDPRCKRGAEMRLDLTDGEGVRPDQIHLAPTGDHVCNRAGETWTSTDPSRVSVHVAAPYETK